MIVEKNLVQILGNFVEKKNLSIVENNPHPTGPSVICRRKKNFFVPGPSKHLVNMLFTK